MNEKQTPLDWKFGLLWFLTCALGTAGGGLLAFPVMWSLVDAVDQVIGETAAGMVAGLLFGGLLALGANVGPGLLLGNKSISARRWIGYSVLAGALGIGATLAVAFSFLDTLSDAAGIMMMGLALGLPVGLAQFVVLRRSGQSAGEWPVVSTVAYLLMGAVILTSGDDSNMAISLGLMGLLLGVVTALGMVWLRRPRMAMA